jgi:hypothetical protein
MEDKQNRSESTSNEELLWICKFITEIFHQTDLCCFNCIICQGLIKYGCWLKLFLRAGKNKFKIYIWTLFLTLILNCCLTHSLASLFVCLFVCLLLLLLLCVCVCVSPPPQTIQWMPRFETQRKWKFQFNIQTDLVTIQVLDTVVNKPSRDLSSA